MKQLFIICSITGFLLFSSVPVRGDTYYRWKDNKGVVHITNAPEKVPEGSGDKVREEKMEPPAETGPAKNIEPPVPPSPKQEPAPAPAPLFPRGEIETPQPEQQLSPEEEERKKVAGELNNAEVCLSQTEECGYKYLPAEMVKQCLSEEDLTRVPRYGYDRGQPLVKKIEVLFYLREKVERLKQQLRQLP